MLIGPAGVVAARDGQTGAFAVISILGMIIIGTIIGIGMLDRANGLSLFGTYVGPRHVARPRSAVIPRRDGEDQPQPPSSAV